MYHIKLDAISSTNDFLKQLISEQIAVNFTVVSAKNQTDGKGQRGAIWQSESGKNLTFSVLIKDVLVSVQQIYLLNICVSLAIINVLEQLKIPEVAVKWPNDIMSGNYKIGGILIENSFKSDGEINSIVGIGLNVNQTDFSDLFKASSLLNLVKREFDLRLILEQIVHEIKRFVQKLVHKQEFALWESYHNNLYKKGIPMPFENAKKNRFMGIIQKVTPEGKLEVLLEDDSVKEFSIKEIRMLY